MTSSSTQSPSFSRSRLTCPLVSVVVVCFNHAPFIRACLDSVVGQTYSRLQLIVVDNASADSSRDVIRSVQADIGSTRPDLDFEAIFSTENGHETGAILQGFPRTRGSYVIFVDGDDLLLPGCIETHVKAHLVSRIPVGLTSVDMYQSDGDDIVVGTGPLVSAFIMSRRGLVRDLCRMSNLDAFDFSAGSVASLTPDDLHYAPPSMANEWVWSPSSGLCFRREIVEFLLATPPRIRAGADNYLVRGACALSGGISIDRALAVYRMHGSNVFTKQPALANLQAFDRTQRADLDAQVMSALIECFRANATLLGERLEDPDLFIKGIGHFASIAPELRARQPYSSVMLQLLVENREIIVRSFGAGRYRKWLTRYVRPGDVKLLVKRYLQPS